MKRFCIIILLLLAGIVVPFAIWGDQFDAALSLEEARNWMARYGSLAWVAGVGLLVADIALPIPSTVVMSAMGLMYGWWWGGLASALGSILSGIVAYAMCRVAGHRAALWVAGAEGLAKGEALFAKHGGWLVATSRWMPVLPEAVACLAGLVRMPLRPFLVALVCGSLPMGFAFAAIGDLGSSNPALAIALSTVVPVLLWLVARHFSRH